MTTTPPCPKCQSSYAYEDGAVMICPECGHEWNSSGEDSAKPDAGREETIKIVRDANGGELKDGDTVTVIKDLKFRGGVVKVGTKVKEIRLVSGPGNDGHDIDCKVPGIGPMGLKSEFVKKITD